MLELIDRVNKLNFDYDVDLVKKIKLMILVYSFELLKQINLNVKNEFSKENVRLDINNLICDYFKFDVFNSEKKYSSFFTSLFTPSTSDDLTKLLKLEKKDLLSSIFELVTKNTNDNQLEFNIRKISKPNLNF